MIICHCIPKTKEQVRMLPTTGRFKNFNCPFYDTCICERPYCHFKHTKKEAVNDTNLISELVSKAVHKVLNSNLSTKPDATPEKPDDQQTEQGASTSVTYNPTPIAQLNKIKSTTTATETPTSITTTTTQATAAANIEKKNRHIPIQYTPEQPRSSRSAPKLEYTIPDYSSNTSAGYSPAVNNYSSSVSYVPSSIKTLTSSYSKNEAGSSDADQKGQIYVPSNVNSNESYTNLGSPGTSVKYSPTRNLGVIDNISNEYVPKYNDEFIDDFLNDPNIYEPTEIASKKNKESKSSSTTASTTATTTTTSTTKSEDKTKNDDKSKKHSSSSKSSSSSSSRSKSKDSSSSSKHSSSSSRDKHKSKESDQKNGCDKKHKSSSDKHKHSKNSSDSHKSSSSSSRDRDKHKSSSSSDSKSKSKEKQSEKDKSNDKVKSSDKSKSSSKSNDKDKVSKDKDKHKSKTKQPVEEVPPVSDDMDLDDYPDDISDYESDEMEQCKRIFEEYQAPVEVPQQPEIKVPSKSSSTDPLTISKKRVAHDKSTNVYRDKPTKAAPVKNAALVMTNRYKIIQAQIEQQNRENENKAAQAFAAKQLKQGLKRSMEYQQQVANIFEEKSQDNHYQAISSKIKRIAHVPNVSSLLNAKKKMEEKSSKEPVNKTPTQTVTKGSKRVAHTPELSFADIPTVLQSERSKLPVNVRSRYLFLMTKECVKLYVSKQAAYDRALNEELNCYSKCSTINTYKNSIMLSINRVRKEAEAGVPLNGSSSHLDNTSEFEGLKLYNNLLRWALSEDELVENGFPRTGAAKKGHAVFKLTKTIERIPEQCQLCVRCKKIFRVDEFGFPVFQEDCIYHPLNRFVFRGETRYICCKQPPSSDGCCICNSHVFEIRDPSELTGFVSTFEPEDENDPRSQKVYALDCEMVYTTRGSELARVTVIDSKCDVVYESLVKPLGYILDYNTRFSGLTLEMLENVTKKITEVQATLLLIFNSKTILVGHSLESDLKALRIIHDTVVDTSVLFPHKMGPPRKRALRNLASDYLKKIIQNDESGHDSAEDAITCMELLVWKLKEELKTR